MNRLLVANRGEVALRVFRTAKAMGLTTIALYTDEDADAPHVRAADESVWVPSYLYVDGVVAAAQEARADAVHPGYGFLSERAAFARAVKEAGITLVGPTPEVMDQMGRKDAAREIAVAAGVPVVPAYDLDDDPASFAYPVLVKAAAGGGGKGMRTVERAADYAEALAAAKREAAGAFGDDAMLIEKYVERGRHIEVQVMGDTHGNVVHLAERDCSPQRRHQKVLEESPAPTLDDATRARIRESGVALARQVGYTGAGTVEFLLDADTGDFYFLEMNTRLQVEHPVTESVVSVRGGALDLVELQLRVADGEALAFTQDDVQVSGHAIEARVYAEDAFGGFLPQAGTASVVHWPEGADVRVDHALESGQVVSTAFDPMLGKVIAVGADREAARQALVAALDETAILGLTTNTGFLRALAATPEFAEAAVDTAWLDRNAVAEPSDLPARWAVALDRRDALTAQPGPWRGDGFRLTGAPAPIRVPEADTEITASGDSRAQLTTVSRTDAGGVSRLVFHARMHHDEHPSAGTVTAFLRHEGRTVEVVLHGQRHVFAAADPFREHVVGAGDGVLLAPMPGTVLSVSVAPGEQVAEGQTLGVLEAMKMELALKAPFAGTVGEVGAAAGDQVALGVTLFVVEPEEAEDA